MALFSPRALTSRWQPTRSASTQSVSQRQTSSTDCASTTTGSGPARVIGTVSTDPHRGATRRRTAACSNSGRCRIYHHKREQFAFWARKDRMPGAFLCGSFHENDRGQHPLEVPPPLPWRVEGEAVKFKHVRCRDSGPQHMC